VRCPKCMGREIREGAELGPGVEVFSLDGLYQCIKCGYDNFVEYFQSSCPEGCAEVGYEK